MNRDIKHLLSAIIIGIVVTGCQEQDNYTIIKEFPQTKGLSCYEIQTPPVLLSPVGLLLTDSAVITLDLRADTLFRVFKMPQYEYIGGLIRRGQGPGEETFVDPYMQRFSDNKFMYRSQESVKFMNYNTQSRRIEQTEEVRLPDDLFDYYHIFPLADSLIGVKVDKGSRKEFISFNYKNNMISDFGEDFPHFGKDIKITDDDKPRLFAKANTIKPDGTAFACVYDKFPIMRIYSNTGKLQKEVRLDNGQPFPTALTKKEAAASEVENMVQDYRMIKSTDRYIFALYIGKKSKELSPGLNDFSNIIHVWDWDGNPIAELKLDKSIFTFDVCKDNAFLIASSLERMDALYQYKLDL